MPGSSERSGSSQPRGDAAYYIILGVLTLIAASAPYLIGWLRTPAGHIFSGLVYNIDDCAVYLSWINQAAQGHFFQHSQFTTSPQHDVLFNVFFLLLGTIVRLTGLSAIVVYHGARVVFGALLLWAVAALLREALSDPRARRLAFALICVSAGFGWLAGGYNTGRGYHQPIDLWQPEAITFLCLYFAPLFSAALALIVVFLTAALRVENAGRIRDVWPAAVAGALLGNFHSYDVIHIFAVWGIYRIVSDTMARKLDIPRWAALVVAGIASLPTTVWEYWAIRTDPVFHQRALISATLSPPVWFVLLGYGFVLLLALAAAFYRGKYPLFPKQETRRFFLLWAVIGIAVAYVPVAFQRKLIMGTHIPLCVLAGAALATLTARLSGDFPKIAAAFAVLLTVPSNIIWMMQDVDRLSANIGSTDHQPYFSQDEWNALQWLRSHTQLRDAVLVSPDAAAQLRFPGTPFMPYLSVYVPAYGGCTVYNGHWSETDHFGGDSNGVTIEERIGKIGMGRRFFEADVTDAFRIDLLRANNIRYVLYANRLSNGPLTLPDGSPLTVSNRPYIPVAWATHPETLPPFLKPVYSNTGITLYEVQPLPAAATPPAG